MYLLDKIEHEYSETVVKGLLRYYHHLLLTYPLKIIPESGSIPPPKPNKPSATQTNFLKYLYDVKPEFETLDPNFFKPKFEQLEKALGDRFDDLDMSNETMKDYFDFIGEFFTKRISVKIGCIGESEFQRVFETYVAHRCLKILQVLRLTLKREYTESQYWGTSYFYPDILIKDGNKHIFLAEMEHPDLEEYNKDGRPKTDDPKFNRIGS